MTIKIEIEVPSDLVLKGAGSEYLDRAAKALGWARGVSSVSHPAVAASIQEWPDAETAAREVAEMEGRVEQPEPAVTNTPRAGESEAQTAARRERGKPSPGKARRTKEEIAEDEAADAADAAKANAATEAGFQADNPDDVKLAVSTGEERIGPDDEQDAADEAAETEKTGLAPIDVLRRLVGAYQKEHGMPAAVKLCQEGGLIGKPIHELDDAGIEAAIAAMQAVSTVEKGDFVEATFKSDGVGSVKVTKPEPKAKLDPKTKADLVEAMMRYGDKFDGTRDQAKMKFTLEDCPRIFAATFGDSVQKLSQVPEDMYAEAVAAVEAAIEADPYGRAK